MKQHKWHKEIKAWADGAEIESYAGKCDDIWDDAPNPNWNNSNLEYRIKPKPEKLSAIRDDQTIDALELAIVALLYDREHANAVIACEEALRRLKGE